MGGESAIDSCDALHNKFRGWTRKNKLDDRYGTSRSSCITVVPLAQYHVLSEVLVVFVVSVNAESKRCETLIYGCMFVVVEGELSGRRQINNFCVDLLCSWLSKHSN